MATICQVLLWDGQIRKTRMLVTRINTIQYQNIMTFL